MNLAIQPVEIDGKHYVGVIMDGDPHRYGPFPDPDEAGAAASRIAAICRAMHMRTEVRRAEPRTEARRRA